MKTCFLLFLLSTSLLFAQPQPTQGGSRLSPVFTAANERAMYWLNQLDQRAYVGAWLDGGNLLKDIVPQSQWLAAMNAIRTPLGPVTSRKVTSHSITNHLPFGTQGNFVIIHYQTSFANKPGASETVIMMSEEIPSYILSTNPQTTETNYAPGVIGIWKGISYSVDGH